MFDSCSLELRTYSEYQALTLDHFDTFVLIPCSFMMGHHKPSMKGSAPLAVVEKSSVVKSQTSGSTSSDDSTGGDEDSTGDNHPDLLDPSTEAALVHLRAILGDEPSEDVLRAMLLAADNDINRAINFFFGTQ